MKHPGNEGNETNFPAFDLSYTDLLKNHFQYCFH